MNSGDASEWGDMGQGDSGQGSVLFNYFITSQEEEEASLT
jgi:hypothetical protein